MGPVALVVLEGDLALAIPNPGDDVEMDMRHRLTRGQAIVLKHVEVKTKKVAAPVHHEDKSARRVVHQSTPVNTKRVVKEIDISKESNNSKPEDVAAAPKSGIELNINE